VADIPAVDQELYDRICALGANGSSVTWLGVDIPSRQDKQSVLQFHIGEGFQLAKP